MTTTTRCASRSATRQVIAISRRSAAVSIARCGTVSAPPRARSSSPGKTVCPPGSLGRGFPGVGIYNPDTLAECPAATFGADGALANADEAIGELVNTTGAGMFAGYYNDPEATDARVRNGMYWSGDLAYRDADGWIYFAGRSGDWLRVDGENMTTAPIERILQRLTPISQVAVYAVPDENVGDQVMAAIVLADGAELTPEEFGRFLADQHDLSPKAWPRYVWLADELPTTATNKVLKRELIARGVTPEAVCCGRATAEAGPTRSAPFARECGGASGCLGLCRLTWHNRRSTTSEPVQVRGVHLSPRRIENGGRQTIEEDIMKAEIHPAYEETTVLCGCGNTFQTRSTKPGGRIVVEVCSQCHPFYTGKQKILDSGGRVARFEKRYGKRTKAEADK